MQDYLTSFTYLVLDVTPAAEGDRLVVADPRITNRSYSGEIRLSHLIREGPRLHTLHLSLWGRRREQEFGGSQEADYGTASFVGRLDVPEPDFHFDPQTHDRVAQWNLGLAYQGRWRGVGELGISLWRADYRKRIAAPAQSVVESRSEPWLYNVIAGASLTHSLSVYAGAARGLEESGQAPVNAANRGQALPAIVTSQREAGLRLALTQRLHLIAGLFDLKKPVFQLQRGQFLRGCRQRGE